MSDIQGFNHIAENLYFFILDEIQACSDCGEGILDYVYEHQISCDAKLILDTGTHSCSFGCNEDFLASISHFKSIAYIINSNADSPDPFGHTAIVKNKNRNTHFFSNYDDAYNWSIEQ